MRLVAFYLVLLLAQGFLSAFFGPVPAPDLFLVAVLTLLGRLSAWQLVVAAYGVGLLQDVTGNGVIGLHAFALAGAAMAASFVRAQLSQAGFVERSLTALAAVAGKWLCLAALLAWLVGAPEAAERLPGVAAVDAALTLFAALWLLPWAEALFERAAVLRKELL